MQVGGLNRGAESGGLVLPINHGSSSLEIIKESRFENPAWLETMRDKALAFEKRNGGVDRAIGMTRYSTMGTLSLTDVQPFHIKGKEEFGIAHKGTIANHREIRSRNCLRCESQSDSETVGRFIGSFDTIEDGIDRLTDVAVGAYNLLMLNKDGKMYIFRDPYGVRDLWIDIDKDPDTGMPKVLVASEDAQLSTLTYLLKKPMNPRRIKRGELITISEDGISSRVVEAASRFAEMCCDFEDVYTRMPDTTSWDSEQKVFQRRFGMGFRLGQLEQLDGPDVVVFPVLESGRYCGEGFAEGAGLPLEYGLQRNPQFDKRTYMHPEERTGNGITREMMAALKHRVVRKFVEGKKVVAVEDSIVRGSTARVIVNILRYAGAKEVHLRVGSPPIYFGCPIGQDHKIRDKLVAAPFYGLPQEEVNKRVAARLAADSVGYLPLEDYKQIMGRGKCYGCFTGDFSRLLGGKVPAEMAEVITLSPEILARYNPLAIGVGAVPKVA